MELAQTIHRLTTDSTFADSMQLDAAAALEAVGLHLTNDELAAVRAFLQNGSWEDLCDPSQADSGYGPWW